MKRIITTVTMTTMFVIGIFSQQTIDYGPLTGDNKFVAQGSSWKKNHLKYYIHNVSNHLTIPEREQAIQNAFRTWENNCNLSFTQVYSSSEADLFISWHTGNHGDNHVFDGHGGVLAHAFFPPPSGGLYAGHLHFDDEENWSVDGSGTDIESVALHEIGHLLGLSHSLDSNATMYQFYSGPKKSLNIDDCQGIWYIYGFPFEIAGPDGPCGLSKYNITKLHQDCSVNWSLSTTATDYSYYQDSNQFFLDNSNYNYVNTSLNADIIFNGSLLTSIHKQLDNECHTMWGSYSQSSLFSVTGTGTDQNGTFTNNETINVLRGNTISLTSDYFLGANISKNVHFSETLSSWSHSGNTITLRFNPSSIAIGHVSIKGVKNDRIYTLNVWATPMITILKPIVQINAKNKIVHINLNTDHIESDYNNQSEFKWDLSFCNITTGQCVYKNHISGNNISVGTEKWDPGVYVLTIDIDNQTFRKKIQLS